MVLEKKTTLQRNTLRKKGLLHAIHVAEKATLLDALRAMALDLSKIKTPLVTTVYIPTEGEEVGCRIVNRSEFADYRLSPRLGATSSPLLGKHSPRLGV